MFVDENNLSHGIKGETRNEETSTAIQKYANISLYELGGSPLPWCCSSSAIWSIPSSQSITDKCS